MTNQKTKLGLSVAFMGALCYGLSWFSGYLGLLLLTGYILLREENKQLQHISLKAVVLTLCFSAANLVIDLIPSFFTFLSDMIDVFGGSFYPKFIYDARDLLGSALKLAQMIVVAILVIMSFMGKDVGLGFVNKLTDWAMGKVKAVVPPAPAAQPYVQQQPVYPQAQAQQPQPAAQQPPQPQNWPQYPGQGQ